MFGDISYAVARTKRDSHAPRIIALPFLRGASKTGPVSFLWRMTFSSPTRRRTER